ncbi:MAG: hypothetical protein PHC92_08130 [Syntrophomonadaceae bacterium]|nr:hypothetical protein [Syntrophomonadaceae bacterium]
MGQKPKAPPEIKKILTDLDMLIQELDKHIKEKKTSQVEKTASLDPQGQEKGGDSQQQSKAGQSSGQGSGGQSSDDQSGKPVKTDSKQDTMQTQKKEDVWQKTDKSLKSIHQSWNTLEPEAIKAGLQIDARDNFEKALEELTINLSQQNSEESLMAAVTLYKHFADLAQVFAMAIPPEFFQLKYEVMGAIAEAGKKDWTAAQKRLPNIQEHWNNLKVQAQDADKMLLNRSEFSVYDLRDAIESEQSDLASIKGEILMKNLKQLEAELSRMPISPGEKGE